MAIADSWGNAWIMRVEEAMPPTIGS